MFEEATFADLARTPGPMILVNATDMIYGTRMAFTQDSFDLICSDLSAFPVARACAASSAMPILLTSITLKNYAGSCGFSPSDIFKDALKARDLPDRRFDLANNIAPFMDSERKPFIHLVDGGVADNLGLRALLVEVKFDARKDPAERTYFKRLPTSFALPHEDVDNLRQAARRILQNSRDFQRLVRDLQ